MSSTPQAYTRYPELQKAVDNCLADRDSLHALRTAINATIEALESQIPDPETTIVIDMEGRLDSEAYMAIYGGLTMIKESESKAATEPGMFSLVGAEAYGILEDIKEQHPKEMADAKAYYDRYYPAQQIPKGEVYTRDDMLMLFAATMDNKDLILEAMPDETIEGAFDFIVGKIKEAREHGLSNEF